MSDVGAQTGQLLSPLLVVVSSPDAREESPTWRTDVSLSCSRVFGADASEWGVTPLGPPAMSAPPAVWPALHTLRPTALKIPPQRGLPGISLLPPPGPSQTFQKLRSSLDCRKTQLRNAGKLVSPGRLSTSGIKRLGQFTSLSSFRQRVLEHSQVILWDHAPIGPKGNLDNLLQLWLLPFLP